VFSRIKPIIYAFVLILGFGFLSPVVDRAEAKVIWGKIELKQGMIGKVTILKDTNLYSITGNKLYVVRKAKKGQEFGVYSYKKDFGGLYGLGGGIYVKKSSSIKYETPSKAKLEQVKQEQLSLVAKSRVTFTLKDAQGTSYKGYIIGSREQKEIASWDSVWAGIDEGDVLYKGNYQVYLQKVGSDTITNTGIKINNYIYNATRKMIYMIPSKYKGQPDLFAIANTESSNLESANLFYVNRGKLFRVKNTRDDYSWATIFYTVRPYPTGKFTFQTRVYDNGEGVWITYTWLFKPNSAVFQLVDTQVDNQHEY
jgi:hypothetical protein